ncbi:MAG: hypothetical protein U9P44_03705, partial [archaeon]|nr:hypothetical protein [archaeon]
MDKLFVARKIMKKAQVQIVSVILLTGITLAAVSGVLWWGLPMLEKSGTNSEVIQAIAVMQDIKTAVAEVS